MQQETLTLERANALFRYDEETGLLWRKIRVPGSKPLNQPAGSCEVCGYVVIRIDGKLYKAHRIIWFLKTGSWPAHEIDHKNCIRDDNRWDNLREATHGQNQANSRAYKNNKSGLKGVTWVKRLECWRASIKANNKFKHLGLFDTANQAHAAYCHAARLKFGTFANTTNRGTSK